MNDKKYLFLLISLILFVSVQCFGTDYYVDVNTGLNSNSGTSQDKPWKTITHALSRIPDNVREPVIIHAAPGYYNSISGEKFPLVMKSDVTLLGADRESTFIICSGGNSSVIICERTTDVIIEGFTLTGGSGTLVTDS